ncbi:unnamed protein product [Cochlearia groenlandica]
MGEPNQRWSRDILSEQHAEVVVLLVFLELHPPGCDAEGGEVSLGVTDSVVGWEFDLPSIADAKYVDRDNENFKSGGDQSQVRSLRVKKSKISSLK